MGNRRAPARKPSATRTDVVKSARAIKRAAGHIVDLASAFSGTMITKTQEERRGAVELGEPDSWQRERRPDEYAENMPRVLVAIRDDLAAIQAEMFVADRVLIARLAELGYHPNGLLNTEVSR